MKHPLLVTAQMTALLATGFVFDASLLEQRIWRELKYQTVRCVSIVEPEARRVWSRFWPVQR
jgi:hypothetical protein